MASKNVKKRSMVDQVLAWRKAAFADIVKLTPKQRAAAELRTARALGLSVQAPKQTKLHQAAQAG
jgi:hypothetical protein